MSAIANVEQSVRTMADGQQIDRAKRPGPSWARPAQSRDEVHLREWNCDQDDAVDAPLAPRHGAERSDAPSIPIHDLRPTPDRGWVAPPPGELLWPSTQVEDCVRRRASMISPVASKSSPPLRRTEASSIVPRLSVPVIASDGEPAAGLGMTFEVVEVSDPTLAMIVVEVEPIASVVGIGWLVGG